MSGERFHVLVNANSGTASKLGQEKIEQLIKDSPLELESFDYLSPEDFNRKLQELLESPLPVLIGGGDGTIAKSAALHLHKKKPFAILPFGTMNLLAQDLQIPLGLPESLHAHRSTRTIAIDVGMVNDRPFLCCAAWGTMPEAAQFREEHRGEPGIVLLPRLTVFIIRQMDRTRKRRIKLTLDGRIRRLRTSMLIVSNNLYDPAAAEEDPFMKTSLQEGVLGVYSVSSPGLFGKARLLFHLSKGGWQDDPAVTEYRAHDAVMETERRRELISIDGEPLELEGPFKFTLMRKALKIIVPASPGAKEKG